MGSRLSGPPRKLVILDKRPKVHIARLGIMVVLWLPLVGIIRFRTFSPRVVVVTGNILVIVCRSLLREILFRNKRLPRVLARIRLVVVRTFMSTGRLKTGFLPCKLVGARPTIIPCTGKGNLVPPSVVPICLCDLRMVALGRLITIIFGNLFDKLILILIPRVLTFTKDVS